MFTSPATTEGDQHLAVGVADDPAALGVGARRHAALRQAGVQVDRVRHHGRADNADRQRDAVRAGKLRHHGVERESVPVGRRDEQLDHVADGNDADERGDHHLDRAKAAALQQQQDVGQRKGDQQTGEQRQAEQQTEADGGAEQFREVGRHGGDLAGDPHGIDQRAGEVSAAELCQALAGNDSEFGGERLKQHGHQIGQQNDPQQQIAELRAALDVGGEVAWVHVGDRGDHRGSGERQEAAQAAPPPRQGLAAGSDRAIRQA